MLGLEFRKFLARRLPFLAGSDRVVGHRYLLGVRHGAATGTSGLQPAAYRLSQLKTGALRRSHRYVTREGRCRSDLPVSIEPLTPAAASVDHRREVDYVSPALGGR